MERTETLGILSIGLFRPRTIAGIQGETQKKCLRRDAASEEMQAVPSICETRWSKRADKRPGDRDDPPLGAGINKLGGRGNKKVLSGGALQISPLSGSNIHPGPDIYMKNVIL